MPPPHPIQMPRPQMPPDVFLICGLALGLVSLVFKAKMPAWGSLLLCLCGAANAKVWWVQGRWALGGEKRSGSVGRGAPHAEGELCGAAAYCAPPLLCITHLPSPHPPPPLNANHADRPV